MLRVLAFHLRQSETLITYVLLEIDTIRSFSEFVDLAQFLLSVLLNIIDFLEFL